MKAFILLAALCLPLTAASAHPWQEFIAARAANPAAYADIGQWDTTQFQLTGDPRHARDAIAQALANWPTTYDVNGKLVRNNTREHSIELARQYGVCRPYMTEDEHTVYEHQLRLWAEGMLAETRDGDSDETTGHGLGLLSIDKALGTDYKSRPAMPGSQSVAEMKATIRSYVAKAKGGEWLESSMYNSGTVSLLLMGVAYLGPEEFPEVIEWLPELAEQMVWSVTADGRDRVQWGDDEHPHNPRLYGFVTLASQVIALGGDKTGNLTNLLACRIKDKPVNDYGLTLHRAFWAGFKPDTLPTNPSWPNPQGLRVTNVGIVIYRKGDTLVELILPRDLGVDHRVFATNLRLYEKEWLLDAPIGVSYQRAQGNHARGFGWGSMHSAGIVGATEAPDGFRAAWVTGGNLRGPYAGNNQPPHFVDEMRLDIEYRHSTRSFHLVDSFKGKLPDLEVKGGPGLQDSEREIITTAPAVWQRIQHMPTEPTATADGYTWRTKGGRLMELKTTAAKRRADKLVDNVNVWGAYEPNELAGWCVRLMSDRLPSETIETTIGQAGVVGPPPDQPPPVDPPPVVIPPMVELPKRIFRRGDVEFREFDNRLERVEIFPLLESRRTDGAPGRAGKLARPLLCAGCSAQELTRLAVARDRHYSIGKTRG